MSDRFDWFYRVLLPPPLSVIPRYFCISSSCIPVCMIQSAETKGGGSPLESYVDSSFNRRPRVERLAEVRVLPHQKVVAILVRLISSKLIRSM